jgi:D-xylose 1-dehydrogenase (NADP+, D-xylono-1,5-lactone-forming)
VTAPPLGWGVLAATAYVAQRAVLPALALSPLAELVAVASESRPAGTYPRHGARRTYATYHALIEDPEVEVVYVPLPNSLHRQWVERAAAAGKHVLCEKPLAPTAADARAMAEACARAGIRLFEAYVTPHHPRTAALAALLASGRLGPLRFARGAFTGVLPRAQDHRWRPEMGGGALLDLGVYCVAPLLAAAGRAPLEVAGAARLTGSGVDASFAGWLDFGGGFAAAIECSFEAPERQSLELVGTEAAVLVDRAHTPGPGETSFTLRHRDGRLEAQRTAGDDPYRRMVDHLHAVVRLGESARWSPTESVSTLEVLDRLRMAALPRTSTT